jgi:hypothetical protein
MNIDIASSSDDSNFVNPPLKRNKAPEQEVCNIPRQPTRQAATHTDGEAAMKKMQKVLLLLSIVHVTQGVFVHGIKIARHTVP